jgi:hypothetical protein
LENPSVARHWRKRVGNQRRHSELLEPYKQAVPLL